MASFTIFSSAFTAFVVVEFEKFRARVLAILALGILAAYFANLIRMTIIVLVGAFTDGPRLENALWTHANIGWLLFLGWIALFWFLMFRYVIRDKAQEIDDTFRLIDLSEDLACVSCGEAVDPEAIPESCSNCGREFELVAADDEEEQEEQEEEGEGSELPTPGGRGVTVQKAE